MVTIEDDAGVGAPLTASAGGGTVSGATVSGATVSSGTVGGATVSPDARFSGRELLSSGSLVLVLLFLIKVYAVAHYSLTTTAGLVGPGLLAVAPAASWRRDVVTVRSLWMIGAVRPD